MNSVSENKNCIPAWLRVTLAITFLCSAVFCFWKCDVRMDGVIVPNSGENLIVPEKPENDYEARQTFVTDQENFSGIVLLAATFMQKRSDLTGTGAAQLFDEKGILRDTYAFPMRRLKDNQTFKIPFAVQKDSAGKKWTVVLKLQKCAFYLADKRGDAELRLNGKKHPAMLKLWCEYPDPDGISNMQAHFYDFRFCIGGFLLLAAVLLFWRGAMERIPEKIFCGVLLPFYTVLFAFCLLYREYIFGSQVYIFYDIGCDTIDQYIPVLIDFLHHPFHFGISATQALGMDGSSLCSTIWDPFNYIHFLLPSPALASGLLYALFLKYELIAIVSCCYFHLLFSDRKLALTGALLWTFTQFNILWGQHYHFLTVIVFITVATLLLELMLRSRKKAGIFLILTAAWLGCLSFYFFYMFSIFAALYILIRSFLCRESFKQFFLHECAAGGCLLFSVLLGLFQIVPWLQAFSVSDRGKLEWTLQELFIVNFSYIGTMAGRFLCPEFFRNGHILYDYYTAPNIFLSLLCIFMIAGLLIVRPKIRTWCIAAAAVIAAFLPIFSFLMTASPIQTRWFFMLHFIFVLGILLFLKELPDYSQNEKMKLLLAGVILFFILLLAGLWELIRGYHLPPENISPGKILYPLFFAVCHLFLYGILLFSAAKKNFFYPVLILVFISELVFGYENAVNRRRTITKSGKTYSVFAGSRYRDFQKMLSEKDELSRVEISANLSSPMMTANLPTLFSVPGSAVYNSLRPKMLRVFAGEQIWQNNPNVFEIRESRLADRLLGIRRKIVNHQGIPAGGLLCTRSGEWKMFEMPGTQFGYVLPASAECPQPANMACQDRLFLMYSHWWHTSAQAPLEHKTEQYDPNGAFYHFLHQPGSAVETCLPLTKDHSLCPEFSGASELPKIIPADRPLLVNLPKTVAANGAYILLVDADCFAFDNIIVSDNFSRSVFSLFPGRHRCVFFIPFRNASFVRIAPRNAPLHLYGMELIYDPDFSSRLDRLASRINASAVRNVNFCDGVWSADVENCAGGNAMLCVPFSYRPGWTAVVNGKETPVQNINNGLLGIRLPDNGTYCVRLSWAPPGQTLMRLISFASFGLLLCAAVFPAVEKYRKHQRKKNSIVQK